MSWFARIWTRLWCLHHWVPVYHWLHGSHSQWDCISHPKRCWQCVHCGKQKVTRYEPINHIES